MQTYLLILLILSGTIAEAKDAQPAYSAAGKKKVQENLLILDQNIQETDANRLASHQNIQTLESEIADLNRLESEHIELRKKYAQFIKNAQKEIETNENAIQELLKYEEKVKTGKEGNAAKQIDDLDRAKREKQERAVWKQEAEQKLIKVTELERSLNRNLDSIKSRKAPLESQRKLWTEKQRSYEKLHRELQAKKTETQRLLKN